MKNVPIITFAAYSGTGKTTYLEKLIPCLKAKGLRVAVIKHDGHDFQMDMPGTDTDRIANAGADAVAIVSDYRFALLEKRTYTVAEISERIQDVDLILTEGFKHGPYPKVALYRKAAGKPMATVLEKCIAVVTDTPMEMECPVFSLDAPNDLADYLVELLVKNEGKENINFD